MSTQPLELGQEYPLSNEQEYIDKIAEFTTAQVPPPSNGQPAKRDQHAKNHGVLWAEFKIADDIPADLRHGLFQQLGKTYFAWIRYSNSAQTFDDREGGTHGMAMKILGVEGPKALETEAEATTHDLIMIDHPTFFIRTIPDYAAFFGYLANVTSGKKSDVFKAVLPFFLPGILPTQWRLHELRRFLELGTLKRLFKPESLLDLSFFSVTPYQLGPHAIKFYVKPHPSNKPINPRRDDPNYLRIAIAELLKERDAGFDFYLQVQTDANRMLVEDSTLDWQGAKTVKVATIRIPKQLFESDAQMSFSENLSYTPWHALQVQRPLGSMNRARKQVYQATSRRRHELNHIPVQEPTVASFQPTLL
jgi:catalase